MLKYFRAGKGDFRLFAFYDTGWLTVIDALPGQADHYDLASYGFGGRLRMGAKMVP